MIWHVLLAAAPMGGNDEIMKSLLKSRPPVLSKQMTVVIVGVVVVSLALFIWAMFIRRRPKEVRGSLVLERPSSGKGRHSSSGRRRRRKRRPSHPDNWGRNPTLAETGGLPPPRPDEIATPPANTPAPEQNVPGTATPSQAAPRITPRL